MDHQLQERERGLGLQRALHQGGGAPAGAYHLPALLRHEPGPQHPAQGRDAHLAAPQLAALHQVRRGDHRPTQLGPHLALQEQLQDLVLAQELPVRLSWASKKRRLLGRVQNWRVWSASPSGREVVENGWSDTKRRWLTFPHSDGAVEFLRQVLLASRRGKRLLASELDRLQLYWVLESLRLLAT